MTQLAALSVTPAVRAWLGSARHARILHVFDHALNLIAGQAVLSLVTPQIGDGPFNAVIPSDNFPPQIAAFADLHVTPDSLYIGDLLIDFSAAQLWNPHLDWHTIRARAVRIRAFVPILREILAQHAPASSLATLVVDLPAPESWLEAQVVATARQHAYDLHQSALSLNRAQCTMKAKQLAGLGTGLTPAGDDWLLGCALAAHSGFPSPEAAALLLIAVRLAAPGTNPFSANWLRAAVNGACSRFWHALLASCLYQDAGAVQRAALDIVKQGHSSGADALAGFLAQVVW
jgi:hypothetical protein